MAEQVPHKEKVAGSSPALATKLKKYTRDYFNF